MRPARRFMRVSLGSSQDDSSLGMSFMVEARSSVEPHCFSAFVAHPGRIGFFIHLDVSGCILMYPAGRHTQAYAWGSNSLRLASSASDPLYARTREPRTQYLGMRTITTKLYPSRNILALAYWGYSTPL